MQNEFITNMNLKEMCKILGTNKEETVQTNIEE